MRAAGSGPSSAAKGFAVRGGGFSMSFRPHWAEIGRRTTTVVFDASVHPGDFALDAQYQGLGILFALGDENADARIEQLIARALQSQDADGRIFRSPDPPGGQSAPNQIAHG